MRNASTLPVIGPLLLRRNAQRLVRAVRSGDLNAVRELATIAISSSDAEARAIAWEGISSLSSQDAIDVLCREVLIRDDRDLRDFIATREFAPRQPEQRALFFFITGQDDALQRLDPEPHHPILAMGYRDASPPIRARAIRSGKGRGQALVAALLETDPDHAAREWSYGEWGLVVESLAEEEFWESLWMLVGLAPPEFALYALHRMRDAGWLPTGDTRQVFLELVRDLPEAWVAPMPERPLFSREVQESRNLRLAFSYDGTLLAAGSCDGRVTIWQVASGRLAASCATCTGSIRFLVFTPDNSLLVSGGDQGTLQASGLSGEAVWAYDDPGHRITTAILSGAGNEILAGDNEGGVLNIRCRTGAVLAAMPGHSSPVTAITATPDARMIATGHADGTVCCRDTLTRGVVWTVPGTGDPVRTLGFMSETEGVLVIREHSLPVLLSQENGEPVRTFAGHTGPVSCHTIFPGSSMIAVGGDGNILRIWQREEYPIAEIPLYNRPATCCAISPGSTLLAAGCNDGTVYYFSIPGGAKVKEFRAYRRPVNACAISPDGRLLSTTGWDGTVTLRDVPTGELLRTLRRPTGAVTALAFAGRGIGILAGTADGTARIFSHDNSAPDRAIEMYTPAVRALAASSGGTYLACAGKEPGLRFWDVKTGSLVASCDGLKTTVRCLAFLPDGKTCISGGWDGMVRLWDAPSGTEAGKRAGHTSNITCCAVNPSGEIFITGSNDTTVRIWDTAGKKEPVILRDAAKQVSCCAISPEGTLLAAAGPEPVIRLYSLPEGTPAGTIPQIPGKPTVLAFTSDSLALAAGYASGMLGFYAVHDRALIRTLHAHAGAVTGIIAVPGEDCLVTGGEDGRVHTFAVPYLHSLSHATTCDLVTAQEQVRTCSSAMADQWRFLERLIALRLQNEIELCPVFYDAGVYDIQIVG